MFGYVGQEFLLVVSGKLKVVFETGQSLLLGKDEGAFFDSSVGHAYLSIGRKNSEHFNRHGRRQVLAKKTMGYRTFP